jgi:hypothetical protein
MTARLTIYTADQPVRSFLLDDGTEYQLGRGAACQIRIADARVSRTHARIAHPERAWQVEDLGSKNGLQVDGKDCRKAELADGAWISFGGLLASFRVLRAGQLAGDRQEAASRWESTVELSRRLDPADIEQLLAGTLAALLEVAGMTRGFIMLPDPQGRLGIRARSPGEGSAAVTGDFPGSRSVVEQVLATRGAVVASDTRADLLLARRPSIESGSIRALACLPLLVGEQLAGVVYLDSLADGKVVTALDMELLEAFVSHAALLLGAASLRDELAELAALLPAEMSQGPGADALLRRLQAALPGELTLQPTVGIRA